MTLELVALLPDRARLIEMGGAERDASSWRDGYDFDDVGAVMMAG